MKNKAGKITVTATILIIMILGAFYVGSQSQADQTGRYGYNDLKYSYIYSLSGSAPYIRLVNKQTGETYDAADTTDYLNSSATWTDTDIALTDQTATQGGWLIPLGSNVPDGVYDMLVYDVSVAAGSRSSSDALAFGKHVVIQNDAIVIMSDN